MKKDHLDIKISESYKEVDKIIYADPDEAYKKFLISLNKEKETNSWLDKFLLRYYKGLIAAGLIIAFILGNVFTGSVTAAGNYIKNMWVKVGNDIQNSVDINNNPVTTDVKSEEYKSLTDLIGRTSLEINTLGYIPAGVYFEKVQYEKVGEVERLVSTFKGNNGSIRFTQMRIMGTATSFSNVDDVNSKIVQYSNDRHTYNIVVFNNGQVLCKYTEPPNLMIIETRGITYDDYVKILDNVGKIKIGGS